MIHYIEGNQLTSEVIHCTNIVIAFFCMNSSKPCEEQNTFLREIEKQLQEDISVFKINIEEDQETKMRYNLSSVPTLIFFKEGVEIERKVGLTMKEDLLKFIQEIS